MAKTAVSLDLLVNLKQHFTSLTHSQNSTLLKSVKNSLLIDDHQAMPISLVQSENKSAMTSNPALLFHNNNINALLPKAVTGNNDSNNNENTAEKTSMIDVESDIEQSSFENMNVQFHDYKKHLSNYQTSMVPALDVAMSNSFSPTVSTPFGNHCESSINKYPDISKPKRRSRIGGTSVKTAEVWRFFTQIPPPEQAATCSLCQKIIKATNSSTTGMIRHLRSCHSVEYQILQEARRSNLIIKTLKNAAPNEALQILQGFGISTSSNELNISALSSILNSANKTNPTKDKNHSLPTIPSFPFSKTSSIPSHNYRKHHTVESIIGDVNKTDTKTKISNNFPNDSAISNQYLENVFNIFRNSQQAMSFCPLSNNANTFNLAKERKILSANKTNGHTIIKNSVFSKDQRSMENEKQTSENNKPQYDKAVSSKKESELRNINHLFSNSLYSPGFVNAHKQSSESSYLKNGAENISFCHEPPQKQIRLENLRETTINDLSANDDSAIFLSDFSTYHTNDIEKNISTANTSKFLLTSPISNEKLLLPENQSNDFFAESCRKGPMCASTPRNYNFEENRWLSVAKKLDQQIALMILIDKSDSELLVDRPGFRGFIKAFFPKYHLPSSEKFRNEIIPLLCTQLHGDFSNLQSQFDCNNPFGLANSSDSFQCGLVKGTEGSSHQPCLSATLARHSGISPSTTIESGFQDFEDVENQSPKSSKIDVSLNNNDNGCGNNNSEDFSVDDTIAKSNDKFKELVQNSIRSAQNISQSFFYSIKVDNENSTNNLNELANRLSIVKNEEIEKNVISDDNHSSETNSSTSCSLSVCSSAEDVDGNNNNDDSH